MDVGIAAASGSPALFWVGVAIVVVANAAAVALPPRSLASLLVGIGATFLAYVVGVLIGEFLDALPALVAAVLVARSWSFRWCLLSLPLAIAAYLLFDVLTHWRWPLLALTLGAYALALAHHARPRPRLSSSQK